MAILMSAAETYHFLVHLEFLFYEIDLGHCFSRAQFISDILEHLEMFK